MCVRRRRSFIADKIVYSKSLEAHAIRIGLVDEYHLFVVPTMLAGGPATLCPGAPNGASKR